MKMLLKKIFKKTTFALASVLILEVAPVKVLAYPNFTTGMQDNFVAFIQNKIVTLEEYKTFALHDFDGDGIPEVLLGHRNPSRPFWSDYDVFKYDSLAPRFNNIGHIAESRYLMKDKFSNALIGYYAQAGVVNTNIQSAGSVNYDFEIYRNYYIGGNALVRNTPLVRLSAPQFPNLNNATFRTSTYLDAGTQALWNAISVQYDGEFFNLGYYKNDAAIDSGTYNSSQVSIRGSYEEVIIHDLAWVKENVILTVGMWRPHSVSAHPIVFSTADQFTKTWQTPLLNFIKSKRGPADTNGLDEWAITPSLQKKSYTRYALVDIDNDNVPEVFMITQREWGSTWSFDVYKYWLGEVRYMGSFEGYGKYLSQLPASISRGSGTNLISFNPYISNTMYQSANRICVSDNLLNIDTIRALYNKNNTFTSYALNASNNLALYPYNSYINDLRAWTTASKPIKTFDLEMTMPTATLIMYEKTAHFTNE